MANCKYYSKKLQQSILFEDMEVAYALYVKINNRYFLMVSEIIV